MGDPKQDLLPLQLLALSKKGIVMKAVAHTDLEVIAGQEHLSLYQWNKQIAEHYFCALCGVYTHHRRHAGTLASFRSILNVWMGWKCPKRRSSG